MPQDQYQQVKAPDGTIVRFPVSMADADISAVMKKNYPSQNIGPAVPLSPANASAMGGAPHGIIGSAWNWLNKPLASTKGFGDFVGSLIGTTKDQEEQRLSDVRDKDIARGNPIRAQLADWQRRDIEDFSKLGSSLTSPLSIGSQYLRGIPQILASLGFGGQGAAQALKPAQPGETKEDVLQRRMGGGGQALLGLAGLTSGGVSQGENVRNAVREMTGTGQSQQNLRTYLHDSATTKVQPFVSQMADNVHQDASQAMSSVLSQIDQAHPEGVFPKQDVRSQIQEAFGDLVKVPEKMPASIQKILNEPGTGKGGWGKTSGPTVGGRSFDLSNPTDLQAYQRMKAQGVFTPAEISRMEGVGESENWSAEQLKQFRSDLGRELPSLKGPTRAAANKTYGILSDQLRGAAKEQSLEPHWLEANGKWQNYMNDFVKGPLRKTMTGQNATDIMQPLTGKNAELSRRILQKYAAMAPESGDAIAEEIRKHEIGAEAQRWSKPSKWDLVVAGISPKAASIRLGIPRVMRSPNVIEAIAGKGLPDIPAKKVNPQP